MPQIDHLPKNWSPDIQNLVDGFLVISPSNQVLFANQTFVQSFGWSQQEIIGKDLTSLLNRIDSQLSTKWVEVFDYSREDKENKEFLLPWSTIDGQKLFSVSATHYQPDSPEGYCISIWRDISARNTKGVAQHQPHLELKKQIEGRLIETRELWEAEKILGNHAVEIAAINMIAQKVHASLTIEEVIEDTLTEFLALLDIDLIFFFTRDGDQLELAGYRSKSLELDSNQQHWVGLSMCRLAAEKNEIVFSNNLLHEERSRMKECRNVGIKSFIAIPMNGQQSNLGVLGIASLTERKFSRERVFFNAMAYQVAIAFSNAKLYEVARKKISEGMKVTGQLSTYQVQLEEIVRKRTEELREQYHEIEKEVAERKRAELAEREQRTFAQALEKTASILNSTLDLDEVLDSILVTLENVIPHDSANIMLVDGEKNIASVARYKGNPKVKTIESPPTSQFPIFETPTLFTMFQSRQPFVIQDVKTDSTWIDQIGSDWIRSYIAAPITFGDEVLGFLNLVSDTQNFYSQEDGERLQAFANHASLAIRNARLYDQAGEVAVLEERQRLARDMHDAVSQTLFTANVIAEALPMQWERDPDKGQEGLTKITQLIRGALSEMRTLIVELRPDTLAKSDLGILINQIAEGATSYSEFTLAVNISGRHNLPEDVQLTFFRVTQEIFNNIVKHARASHITVDFENKGDEVFLKIQDDGRGFDPDEVKSGRLGLVIMRERTNSIGARLDIDSQLNQGTTVQVHWCSAMEGKHGE